MPEVSRFFGIIIRMFYDEHNPPHFHAEYQGAKAMFDFDGNLLQGILARKPPGNLCVSGQTSINRNCTMIGNVPDRMNPCAKFNRLIERMTMWNMNDVTQLEYKRQYVYHIVFDNGTEGEIDFSPYLERGKVFQTLVSLSFFRQARIEGGTIAWPNGADIAPETLYEQCERARQHE